MQKKPRDTQEAVAQLRARGRAGRKKKVVKAERVRPRLKRVKG